MAGECEHRALCVHSTREIAHRRRTGHQPVLKSSATFIRLERQLDCLPILLGGVSPGELDHRPLPDKWSARENLAHLARYQEIFAGRLGRILTEDCPQLPRYAAEQDDDWPRWAEMNVDEVLARMRDLRSELINRAEELSEADLSRMAVHPRFGAMTLMQWLEFFLLHEAHHLLVVMQRVRE